MTLLLDILSKLDRGDCANAKWPDPKGDYWPLCPYHADSHSGSFSVGEKGFKCFSCDASGSLSKLAEKLGVAVLHGLREVTMKHSSISLQAYAEAKGLDPQFLQSLGVTESTYRGKTRLSIPYLDTSGKQIATRYRTAMQGSDRFRWASGAKVHPYGLWRLQDARQAGYVLLVEGESDCHTLWQHGLPALGVPGASTFKAEWTQYLEGLAIYVWREPDQGGDALAQKVGGLLPDIRIITPPDGRKDVSECHLMGDDLPELIERLRSRARGWSELVAERQSEQAAKARELADDLLEKPRILDAVVGFCRDHGLVGEERAVKLLYLCLTSRLLDKPVSVVVKGPSSGGKSYLVDTVLRAFPPDAYLDFTSMSERALIYDTRPIAHRTIVLYEASGLGQDVPGQVNSLAYTIRSLLSEGRIKYTTVEKTDQGMQARVIDRPGPTNLVTTTTWNCLHAENETRVLAITVDDEPEQTAAIFLSLASRATGKDGSNADAEPWHALQTWLALGGTRTIVIPYAEALAKLTNPKAVRSRRDFGAVLSLVKASALLHQTHRQVDGTGWIEAAPEDYAVVYGLLADILDESVEATVSPRIRATVEMVRDTIGAGQESVSISELSTKLGLHKSTVTRRVRDACADGYLRNQEDRRGRPARLILGDPLPDEGHVLPSPKDVGLEKICSDIPSETVQHCNAANGQMGLATAIDGPDNSPQQMLSRSDQQVLEALQAIGQPTDYLSVSLRLRADPACTRQALERLVERGLAQRLPQSTYRPMVKEVNMA